MRWHVGVRLYFASHGCGCIGISVVCRLKPIGVSECRREGVAVFSPQLHLSKLFCFLLTTTPRKNIIAKGPIIV